MSLLRFVLSVEFMIEAMPQVDDCQTDDDSGVRGIWMLNAS